MADKWSSIIENDKSGDSAIIDVSMWMGKATLDACILGLVWMCMDRRLIMDRSLERIGAGAFEYDFGALDDADNPLTKSYLGLAYDYHLRHFPSKVSATLTCPFCSPVLQPSGTLPNYSFSSCTSRDGSQDCSPGYVPTPIIPECRSSERTGKRRTLLPGGCSTRRDKS